MNKIGVIGGRDSVLGFRALGLDTCIAESGEQAKNALHRMAKENYAITISPSILPRRSLRRSSGGAGN